MARSGDLQAEQALPARGDAGEGAEEVGGVAAGGEGGELFAEGDEVGVEEAAVLGVEGVEPPAAGEEPVARVAGGRCRLRFQEIIKMFLFVSI